MRIRYLQWARNSLTKLSLEGEFYFDYGEEINAYPIPRFAYEGLSRSLAKGLTAYH
jgi:hypothetical protein